jgi:hypothetical protein
MFTLPLLTGAAISITPSPPMIFSETELVGAAEVRAIFFLSGSKRIVCFLKS